MLHTVSSIIFVDSFIFIAKVAIFTYTGLFVNPSYTEGWVIFGITVTMYIYESIHSVNDTYEQLFLQTKKVCKRKGKKLRNSTYLEGIQISILHSILILFLSLNLLC